MSVMSSTCLALIENIQRENLNAIEEALALKRLGDEFELTSSKLLMQSVSRALKSPIYCACWR